MPRNGACQFGPPRPCEAPVVLGYWDIGIHLVTAENNNAKKKVQLIDVQDCMIDDCFSIVVLDTKRNGTFFVHLSLMDVQGTKIRINSGVVPLRELSLKNHFWQMT